MQRDLAARVPEEIKNWNRRGVDAFDDQMAFASVQLNSG
jgi:hypothetical protein